MSNFYEKPTEVEEDESAYSIVVDDVKKFYRIYKDKGSQLRDRILTLGRSRYNKREVLNGVSFKIKRGEAVGFIGVNGCGKSTLLKLMTKIIYPNSGSITTYGRISGLIELGAGFHPDMTGRENIYINASIYGLSKSEIDAKIEDIIEFSGIRDAIDTPVRTYSSGMYMRLGFAVAINVNADILLVDEILAVGDAAFQAKCFEALQQMKANGTTIVIVSHSLGQIEEICDKTYWVENGKIKMVGEPKTVHAAYEKQVFGE